MCVRKKEGKSVFPLKHVVYFSDDYNRVILENDDGFGENDYINASYVDVSFCSHPVLTTCPVNFSPRARFAVPAYG